MLMKEGDGSVDFLHPIVTSSGAESGVTVFVLRRLSLDVAAFVLAGSKGGALENGRKKGR